MSNRFRKVRERVTPITHLLEIVSSPFVGPDYVETEDEAVLVTDHQRLPFGGQDLALEHLGEGAVRLPDAKRIAMGRDEMDIRVGLNQPLNLGERQHSHVDEDEGMIAVSAHLGFELGHERPIVFAGGAKLNVGDEGPFFLAGDLEQLQDLRVVRRHYHPWRRHGFAGGSGDPMALLLPVPHQDLGHGAVGARLHLSFDLKDGLPLGPDGRRDPVGMPGGESDQLLGCPSAPCGQDGARYPGIAHEADDLLELDVLIDLAVGVDDGNRVVRKRHGGEGEENTYGGEELVQSRRHGYGLPSVLSFFRGSIARVAHPRALRSGIIADRKWFFGSRVGPPSEES